MHRKLIQLGEDIDSIEDAVFRAPGHVNANARVSTNTDQIEETVSIEQKWMDKLITMFSSSIRDLDKESVECLVLEVIKVNISQPRDVSLTDAVDTDFENKLKEVDNAKLDAIGQLLKLKALVFNEVEDEILERDPTQPMDIDQTSKELIKLSQNSENPDLHNIAELEDLYKQHCANKVSIILKALDNLHIKDAFLNNLVYGIVDGLEKFSSKVYDRHTYYDEVWGVLTSLPNAVTEDPKIYETALNNLKNILWNHSRDFCNSSRNVFTTVDKFKEDVIWYVTSENNIDFQELQFRIDLMIETEGLASQDLYDAINRLHESKGSEVKSEDLKKFMVRRADSREFSRVTKLVADRLKCQEDQYICILVIKTEILKEYRRYCQVLDRNLKENYVGAIKLYLDRLDRLVASRYQEDLSCKYRKEVFEALKKNVALTIKSSGNKDGVKADNIESTISSTLSDQVFADKNSSQLPTAIFEHLKALRPEDESRERSNYERVNAAWMADKVKLQDLFTNSGRINEKEGREVFCRNRTVVTDQGEQYRLSEDFESLMRSKTTYEKSAEEFKSELSLKFKIFKLDQLKDAIKVYNADPGVTTVNIIRVSESLVYYLTLGHLDPESFAEWMSQIHKFLAKFSTLTKYLMFNRKSDQEIISDLRIAIDLFCQNSNLAKKEDLLQTLKSLRNTLVYKTYKAVGFNLFEEERSNSQQELELNNFLRNHLNEIVEERLPEILRLRSFLVPQHSEDFFKNFHDLLQVKLSDQLAWATNSSVKDIDIFLEEEKNRILLLGLCEVGHRLSPSQFVERIVSNQLVWQSILEDSERIEHNLLVRLRIIIEDHQDKFRSENLEELLSVLSTKKPESVEDWDDFCMDLVRLYVDKIVEGKEDPIPENGPLEAGLDPTRKIEEFEAAITNAYNIFYTAQNAKRGTTCSRFMEHIKELENCVLSGKTTEEIKVALEMTNICFVAEFLGFGRESLATSTIANFVYSKFDCLEPHEDKNPYLALLLQMPDSFYNNRAEMKGFLETLFSHCNDIDNTLCYSVREFVLKYYGLFLNEILNLSSRHDISENPDRESDITEALNRLSQNKSPAFFVELAKRWIREEDMHRNAWNFVLAPREKAIYLIQILPFLKTPEKTHLRVLITLTLEKTPENLEVSQTIKSDEELESLIIERRRFPATELMNKINDIFTTEVPISTWGDELVHLRTEWVRNRILTARPTADHSPTQFTSVLNAFMYFHGTDEKLIEAFNTLDLIIDNMDKFETLEEIKQSISAILLVNDLKSANSIIKSSRYPTLDLLFSQLDCENDRRLANSLERLKFVLCTRRFAEISKFCTVFILQMRELVNLDTVHLAIELIIKSKLFVHPELLKDLENKDISMWNSFLEKMLLLDKLNNTPFRESRIKDKQKMADLLYQIGNTKGLELQTTLLLKMEELRVANKSSSNVRKIIRVLNIILNKSCEEIDKLSTDLGKWENVLVAKGGSNAPLTMQELITAMKDGGKTGSDGINASIQHCLESTPDSQALIEQVLAEARNLVKVSQMYKQSKFIRDWQDKEIKEWANCFRKNPQNSQIFSWRSHTKYTSEVLSVIIQAVLIYDRYQPRDTQIMSLLFFLDSTKKGRLANVYTGEGKTLITVMLATCLGLVGKRVDVVTSSKVLAIRDSRKRESGSNEGYAGYFELFGLKASNNCDEVCEAFNTGEDVRKGRYMECDIVYGETSYFQRDYLLSAFFKKGIREGSGVGDALILDEVDSMMIDNAARTLYISHNITDMRHLRDVFIHIWAAVNSQEERYYSEENVAKIKKYINQIISNVENTTESAMQVHIPDTLQDFVQRNLEIWIESAYTAKVIGQDDAYIVGDAESTKMNEIIIMDKDTGVEQNSTKWSNGLHQFIQLKHSGKLSDESLKAVYISNAGYFQSYAGLYGMTGTVGEADERKLLSDVYGIDFFEIPRFKEYRFEYDFEAEIVAGSQDEWLRSIVDNIDENMDQQLTYMPDYIASMSKKLEENKGLSEKLAKLHENLSLKKEELDQEKLQRQANLTAFKLIQKTSDQLISACEKSNLKALETTRMRLETDMNVQKAVCKDANALSVISKYLDTISILVEQQNEESAIKFGQKVKELNIADLSGEQMERIEELNNLINKAQEEINYAEAEQTKCAEDLEFYAGEAKATPDTPRLDSRRAVLIICDSISDLKCVEERVKRHFKNPKLYKPNEYRIYKYDRAYRKFEVSCLESGDIVVATNIAGRGTDLQVSKQVEENGGLHVILSYMPKNFRIEKQAFGRTARAGNKGTATYIVLDPRKLTEDIDISKLMTERDEIESARLIVVKKEQLPRIKLEDELFFKFNRLQLEIEGKLVRFKLVGQEDRLTTKDPLKLQMDSLKNKWAIWLNKMSAKIEKAHVAGSDEVFWEYDLFQNEINSRLENKFGLIDEPGELTKLGRAYLDIGKYSDALDCFDHTISNHKSFASIAYYYKAFCIIYLDGGGFGAKARAKRSLKKSLSLLENDRSRILSRNQILQSINEIARAGGKCLESNYFAKQNEGEAQILSIHINAINSAVGSEISAEHFNAPGIVGDHAQNVFDKLLEAPCDIIKDFRISKKCWIGHKILITDPAKLEKLLLEIKMDKQVLEGLPQDDGFIKCTHDSIKETLNRLAEANIISERQIYRTVDNQNQLKTFPDVFEYCREQVLDDFGVSLANCQGKWRTHRERVKTSACFSPFIYTKEKYIKDTAELIKVEEVIKLADDIEKKLLGRLDHEVFCGRGDQIKNILKNRFLVIKHSHFRQKLNDVRDEAIFRGKKLELEKFLLGGSQIKINESRVIQILDSQAVFKNDLFAAIEKIIEYPESPSLLDQTMRESLLQHFSLNRPGNKIPKQKLVEIFKNKLALDEEQVRKILAHLEFFTKVIIDTTFLKGKFETVKNDVIFFGKRSEIKAFCLGYKSIKIDADRTVQLFDNQSYSQADIVTALKTIVKLSDSPTSEEKVNFDALLTHLNFQEGAKYEAIETYKEYSLKEEEDLLKIKEYVETINLKDSPKTEEVKIDKLDFSVDTRLSKISTKIAEVLKANLAVDKALKSTDFQLGDEEFEVLRAMLTDANIFKSSIFNLCVDREKQANRKPNPELETILMKTYYAGGVISDRDLVLKDGKTGSQELFHRLRELGVIKPPKVNFSSSLSPGSRMDYITTRVENIVQDVFKLDRQSDSLYQANEFITGGIGTESENKELDDKIEVITNVIKQVAGTLKTLPEVKVESKDLRNMFEEGKVPPELLDYIHLSFDSVLDYKEVKGFDWECFLCAMIGLAQIVAGVALEVLSGGSAHFIAQSLISEGIGDIIFAVQAGIEGNFTWKAYGQHKVQSLIICLLTAGVGSFLSKGVKPAKLGVGLATKTAITKAIMKTTVVEACTAIGTAAVNIGTEEISKLIIEELANVHFVQYFEKWTLENAGYKQKTQDVEKVLTELYNRFGVSIAKEHIDACIESSLRQMISGSLGNKALAQVSRLVGGITKGISLAARNLGTGHSKIKVVGAITSVIGKTVRVAEFTTHFAQLCDICNDFYDCLIAELGRVQQQLIDQRSNGTLKLNEAELAQEKLNCSYSFEAGKDLRNVQEKMHIAYTEKIRNGFLQPVVGNLLHMALSPIQQVINSPFANAMEQLSQHIDDRAGKFLTDIKNQHSENVLPLTSRQRKALELRGDIIRTEDITNPSFLKTEVANFAGETIESLRIQHGANVSILVRDGKIYAVLPNHKQFCDNIASENLKVAGNLHLKIAATQIGRNIEIVSPDIHGTDTVVHAENGPGLVKPIGKSSSGKHKESYKIAFIEGNENELGHFAPVIKDAAGIWKVIDIYQTIETKDACFAQCMVFLNEYEKEKDEAKARHSAVRSEVVSKYNQSLGRFARRDKGIQACYHQGETLRPDSLLGGAQQHIVVPLKGKFYPSHNNSIEAKEPLVEILAKLHNELNSKLIKVEKQAKRKLSQKFKPGQHAPVFGVDKDLNLDYVKEEMMMGVLSVEFTNGSTYKIMTVSGSNEFATALYISQDFGTKPTPKPFKFSSQGYEFVDLGGPTGNVYDVFNANETNEKYSKACAAQKLMFALGQHMKSNPSLRIKGKIGMAESFFKKTAETKKGWPIPMTKGRVVLEASCAHCTHTLPVATGKPTGPTPKPLLEKGRFRAKKKWT